MNPKISEEIIQQIAQKVDLVELVGDYVHLKKSGHNYVGLCPFHAEKTPSFSVSAQKQFYHCFGCGAGGNAFTFLMEMEGSSFPEAVAELGDKTGIQVQIDGERTSEQEKEKQGEKDWVLKAHDLTMQLYEHMLLERNEGNQALEYLQQRGMNLETIKAFRVGFAPDKWDFLTSFLDKRNFPLQLMAKGGLLIKKDGDQKYYDRFRGRIMFPIKNRQGQVVAFQGRVVDKGDPKYLNSPETFLFHKSKQLFHFDQSRMHMRKKQKALLFEGVADVLSAYQEGITYTTATLGTALSEQQAQMLRRNVEQVLICYDADRAGIAATRKAAETLLGQQCQVKVAVLPKGYDPDDYIRAYGAKKFEAEIVNGAQTFTAFQLQVLREDLNLQDDGDRMAYLEQALTVISRLSRAVEREHYLTQLAQEFSLSLEVLKSEQFHIYRSKKNKLSTDKPHQKWNNTTNNRKDLVKDQLLPAYQTAEKRLLAYMMRDKQLTELIQDKIGSSFNVEEHNILSAYIYAFYSQGHLPNTAALLTTLHEQDPERVRLASSLAAMEISDDISERELEDLIGCVLDHAYQKEIDLKSEEKKLAEKHGDVMRAAQIAMEVVKMKNKLKSKRGSRTNLIRKEEK